ncbi:MAG TPA: hypothetical protein VME45_04405 [Stellaceae bacterium]|nr:hypothetical protein [Stellaceae bacterium]
MMIYISASIYALLLVIWFCFYKRTREQASDIVTPYQSETAPLKIAEARQLRKTANEIETKLQPQLASQPEMFDEQLKQMGAKLFEGFAEKLQSVQPERTAPIKRQNKESTR